jgi:hypothetical protein
VRSEVDTYDVSLEDDVNFWMNQRMDFNFVDFDRDDSINKEEYEYFLDHPVNMSEPT